MHSGSFYVNKVVISIHLGWIPASYRSDNIYWYILVIEIEDCAFVFYLEIATPDTKACYYVQ